jgi:hypothetical protein
MKHPRIMPEQKIELKHPAGKKAVRMDEAKYILLKKATLAHLKKNGGLTFSALFVSVAEQFSKNKTRFEGSLQWHLEWVKLDLEARKEIKRIITGPEVRYVTLE